MIIDLRQIGYSNMFYYKKMLTHQCVIVKLKANENMAIFILPKLNTDTNKNYLLQYGFLYTLFWSVRIKDLKKNQSSFIVFVYTLTYLNINGLQPTVYYWNSCRNMGYSASLKQINVITFKKICMLKTLYINWEVCLDIPHRVSPSR